MAAEATLNLFSEAGGAIGAVSKVVGFVTAIRADGTSVELQVGDPVYQGDILETGPEGAVGVILADETTFAMAENGSIALDEMVYDPSAQEGSISLSVAKGVFTFVSGQVAKTDPEAMTLKTPVATIGIRGTQAGVDIADGENLTVVLMKEADDFVGEVVVFNANGEMILNQALQAVNVSGLGVPPSAIFIMSIDDMTSLFGTSLYYLPLDGNDSGNDYGVQAGDSPLDEGADIAELAEFETAAGGEAGQPEGGGPIPVVGGDYTGQQTGPGGVPFTPPPAGGTAPPPTTGGGGGTAPAAAPTVVAATVAASTSEPTNTPPTASDDVSTTDEDSAVTIDVLANDMDPDAGDILTLQGAAISNDGLGTVFISDNQIVYDPGDAYNYLAAGEQATVEITYTIADMGGATDTAIASVTVTGTNDLPVLEVNLGVQAPIGGTVVIGSEILSVGDIDLSDQITYRLVDAPDFGSLKLNGTALGIDDTFTQEDIDTGLLTYLNEGSVAGSHDWGGDLVGWYRIGDNGARSEAGILWNGQGAIEGSEDGGEIGFFVIHGGADDYPQLDNLLQNPKRYLMFNENGDLEVLGPGKSNPLTIGADGITHSGGLEVDDDGTFNAFVDVNGDGDLQVGLSGEEGAIGTVTFEAPDSGGYGAADHFTVIASDSSGASLASGPLTVDIDIDQGYQVASGGEEEGLNIGVDD